MNFDAMKNMMLTAARQIELAKAIYGGREAVEGLAEEVGANFRWIEVGNWSAAALIFPEHMHLSIGGTDDRQDWATNLDARHAQLGPMDAHRGFAKAASYLLPALRRAGIESFLREGMPLKLGGHSAGGAIAQCLSMEQFFEPEEVYTFGAPRVWSPVSATVYAAHPWETFRFVMPWDPIPRLPLRTFRLLFGGASYAHTTAAMELHEDGSIVFQDELSAMHRALTVARHVCVAGGLACLFAVKQFPAVLKSHSVDRYFDAIQKGVERVSS